MVHTVVERVPQATSHISDSSGPSPYQVHVSDLVLSQVPDREVEMSSVMLDTHWSEGNTISKETSHALGEPHEHINTPSSILSWPFLAF